MRLLTIVLSLASSLSGCVSLEKPDYELIKTYDDFEIRKYSPHLVAQVHVKGDFDSAGNQGFRLLANYIFGNNTTQNKMKMTAPVEQQKSQSIKMAMTAPVDMVSEKDGYLVSFYMPSKYTLDTLARPLNPQVKIIERPSSFMAARRYSGFWSQSRFDEHLDTLEKALKKEGITPIGKAIFARYNSPYTVWFLRRNEVLIPIDR